MTPNHPIRDPARHPLYTPEERERRNATVWTGVQGVLAPLQFLVFLISVGLVIRFLVTGEGESAATLSVVIKTVTLYLIMVTGCILVLALHSAYLAALAGGLLQSHQLMYLALAAYAAYVVNAGQFLLKLRAARLDGRADTTEPGALA